MSENTQKVDLEVLRAEESGGRSKDEVSVNTPNKPRTLMPSTTRKAFLTALPCTGMGQRVVQSALELNQTSSRGHFRKSSVCH